MNADAPFHSAVAGATSIAFGRQLLQSDSTLDRADHRAKLDQRGFGVRSPEGQVRC
jgi:hypothetical protein